MNKLKFAIDSLLNIVSVSLPLVILQLIALPVVASTLGGEDYGSIIVLISIVTVVSFPMGNVLNNVRLLKQEDYQNKKLIGDFNIILSSGSLISAIIIIIISIIAFPTLTKYDIFLLTIITVLSLFKDYLVVSFRLVLNYKGILLNNVYLSIGYFIGTLLFFFTIKWQYIYLSGLICSIIYILRKTSLHKEPFKTTNLFKETFSKTFILYIAGLLKNIIKYADKILLLPLLGPVNVAIYYSASIIGKIISLGINPVNSVILSYLVRIDKINYINFIKIIIAVSVTGFLGYWMTILISPYFLFNFYKEWAEESLKIIYITTATSVIEIISGIIHPFNLRFNNIKWQIYFGLMNFVIYISLALYLTDKYQLIGFTWAVCLSTLFRLLLQVILFFSIVNKVEK